MEEKPKIKSSKDEESLKKIIYFINDKRGIDLCSYRQTFVFRHLRSRLLETGSADHLDYIDICKKDPKEIDRFLDALSINVTHFFRDVEVFESFKKNILPGILKRKISERGLIRVWSAGCASGQEPYSLAILLRESLGEERDYVVKIWATDIDADALQKAQKAEYDQKDFREVEKKLLEKYFDPSYNGKYVLKEEIKRLVRFEKLNLITDQPLKFMDVIFCRNVMIYFNKQQQEILFKKFYNALVNSGYLVIAKVESIWDRNLFIPVDMYNKIYQKAA